MQFEEAISQHLLADQELAGFVNGRIYWDIRPQASALPAITLQIVAGAPLYSDEGNTLLRDDHLQVDCWAKDSDVANGSSIVKELAREVEDALGSVSMIVGNVLFPGVFPENRIDFSEEGQAGELIYRRMLEYDVWHFE